MKIIIIMSSLILTQVVYGQNQYKQNQQQELISKFGPEIRKIMDQYTVPGAAIALVDDNGIIWSEGFGVTQHNGKKAVNTKTLFSIQSQTKMFTALGVMRAAQDNLVDLNLSVENYLPDLKVNSVFEKNPISKITLKSLLSHTAGFPHDAPIGNNFASQVSFQDHMNSILPGLWLQFPVNKGFNYSNVGIDLAGYVLQQQSKIPYQEFIQQQVLEPLEMSDSTFDAKKYLSRSNHAIGYIEGIDSTPVNYSMIPSGGLYSNVDELSHYVQFQLQDGSYKDKVILNKLLLKTMLKIPYPQHGQIAGNALGIWKDQRLNTTYYSHLGRGFGFANDLEWYPQYHLGIIVLTNKYDTHDVDIKIAHMIIDSIISSRLKKEQEAIEKLIIGQYVSNIFNIEIVKHKITGQIAIKGMINFGPVGNSFVNDYYPINYIGNNKFYSPKDQKTYRILKKGPTGVVSIQRIEDGFTWYMNTPLKKHKKSLEVNKPEASKYIGVYELQGYGGAMSFNVHLQSGSLYLEGYKLIPKQDHIFIMSNGQVVIFNDDNMIWNGIFLTKK